MICEKLQNYNHVSEKPWVSLPDFYEISEIKEVENYGVTEDSQILKGYKTTYEVQATETNNLELIVTNSRDSSVPTGNHIGTGLLALFGITIIGLAFLVRKKVAKSQ